MVRNIFFVAAGGAVGAVLRYLITFLPVSTTFPWKTMITNICGAIMIGIIVGIVSNKKDASEGLVLFLKTGVCGGFTTFSTFSLEVVELFENEHFIQGTAYGILSFMCCIIGVIFGKIIGGKIAV